MQTNEPIQLFDRFIVKCYFQSKNPDNPTPTIELAVPSKFTLSTPHWELYVDRSSNFEGCDTKTVLERPNRQVF
jgi:hypothetical protein